jgi:hypothetical protein
MRNSRKLVWNFNDFCVILYEFLKIFDLKRKDKTVEKEKRLLADFGPF